jgi:hypothetical protein
VGAFFKQGTDAGLKAGVRFKRNLSNTLIVTVMTQPLQIPVNMSWSSLQEMKAAPPPREEIAPYETGSPAVAAELPIFDKPMTRA